MEVALGVALEVALEVAMEGVALDVQDDTADLVPLVAADDV